MAIPTQIEPFDGELVQRIKDSDQAAFKQLYYRYYEPLFRFIWHKTRDHERTRDFVQDLFFRLWEHRANLDERNNVRAYLYRMASNLVSDFFRKKQVEQKYREMNPAIEPVSQPEADFDLHEGVQEAISDLPEPVRTVFQLSRFQGLKYTEIADKLGISIKTVESRMSKALNQLRDALAPFLVLLLVYWVG